MKNMKRVVIFSFIFLLGIVALSGCSETPVEQNTIVEKISKAPVIVNEGVKIKVDSEKVSYDDTFVNIPLSLESVSATKVSGMDITIKGFSKDAETVEFVKSGLTKNWIVSGNYKMEDHTFKIAMVNIDPLDKLGTIGTVVARVSRKDLKAGDSINISGVITDGEKKYDLVSTDYKL